jgi:hypothetical protein
MTKRLRLFLSVALLVLFTAAAVWSARHDFQKSRPVRPFKEFEPRDYLISKASAVFQPTIHSPRDTVLGYTSFDEQHDTRVLRMNALDYQDSPGLHFSFMRSNEPFTARYVDYTYRDTSGWGILPAQAITGEWWSGYNAIDLIRPLEGYFKSHSRAVVCYHSISVPPFIALSIEPNTPGAMELQGAHYWYDIPDRFSSTGLHGYYPACGIDGLNRIHVISFELPDGSLGYVRCQEKSGDKLMCWAPGKDSVILDKETYYTDQNYEVAIFGKSFPELQTVATSKVSNKVSLIWAFESEIDPTTSYFSNDIYYIESSTGGDDWFDAAGFPERTNITEYDYDDYLRAYCDLSAVYDMNDSLHIFWHTHYYDPQADTFNFKDVTLWHWSKTTERVCDGETVIANEVSHAEWDVDAGSWNALISKMQSGVGYDPGLPNYNHLYLVWAQFDTGKTSQTGWTQGDLYVSVSTDGGMVWQEPLNVTSTTVPDCAPGDCASDHYPSIAERVDTAVYLQWLYDLDAGGSGWDEGIRTYNPVLLYHLPVDSIPIVQVARIDWSPRGFTRPPIHVPLNGLETEYLTIENIGTDTLYVYNISSGAGWLGIDPTSATLSAGGCPVKVNLTLTGGSEEAFLVDSIRIVSNDAEGNDDIYVRIHVIVSDEYMPPDFEVVSNPTYYLSVSNTGNLGHQVDTTGMYLYTDLVEPEANFIFDGSPIIGFISPEYDTLVGRYIFEEHYLFPATPLEVATYPGLKTKVAKGEFWPVRIQIPPEDQYWPWWRSEHQEHVMYSGDKTEKLNWNEQYMALLVLKLFHDDPPDWWVELTPPDSIPETYLGMALDIDAPSDSGAWNYPDYNENLRYGSLQGYGGGVKESYGFALAQRDTCYELAPDTFKCWPDPASLIQPDQPYAMHLLRNDVFVYAQSGFRDDSLYKYMSIPGYSVYGTGEAEDYTIVTTGAVVPAHSYPDSDTVEVRYAMAVSDHFAEAHWDTLLRMIQCGNVDRDKVVGLADVVYYVGWLFRGGGEIWMYMGDVDGDGTAALSDIVYLINYMFRAGPPPRCDYFR